MSAMITIAVWAACGYFCMEIGARKGRNKTTWLVLGVLFGFFAVFSIAFLPPI